MVVVRREEDRRDKETKEMRREDRNEEVTYDQRDIELATGWYRTAIPADFHGHHSRSSSVYST